jgi:hypothetical protein
MDAVEIAKKDSRIQDDVVQAIVRRLNDIDKRLSEIESKPEDVKVN